MNDIQLIDYDLQVRNGDLTVDFSDDQHLDHIVLANKGDFKEHPLLGVGIRSFLKDEDVYGEMTQEINRQLESDGAEVESVTFDGVSKVNIDASYS